MIKKLKIWTQIWASKQTGCHFVNWTSEIKKTLVECHYNGKEEKMTWKNQKRTNFGLSKVWSFFRQILGSLFSQLLSKKKKKTKKIYIWFSSSWRFNKRFV